VLENPGTARRRHFHPGWWLLMLAPLCCWTAAAQTSPRCEHHTPQRQVFFGDLHVHTGLSHDAATQGTVASPWDAYRFAMGQEVGIPPYKDGKPLRTVQLRRPLDFAAVTDHAELLGEVRICTVPGMAGHNSVPCLLFRHLPRISFFVTNLTTSQGRRHRFCKEGGRRCLEAAMVPWQETIEAAQHAQDRSPACRFTSLIGYEWTGNSNDGNIHRNVIFNDSPVPSLPLSFIEASTAEALWEGLARGCAQAGDHCQALVIPHNSNLSIGEMFRIPANADADYARRRSHFEPLVEVLQHKGSSECFAGAWQGIANDELCAFEQLPYPTFTAKFRGGDEQPSPHGGFLREVLREGLRWQNRLGANPLQLGFIGSTDTHLGTPGLVAEKDYPGHGGAGLPADPKQAQRLNDDLEFNPGGLAAVWAEENSRQSIFAALRRRESYATSGPRISLRLFGGWDYAPSLCGEADLARQGYAGGVPMGGDLSAPPDGQKRPRMLVAAWQDAAGRPLERIQIIKGWVDDQGQSREKVVDVIGSPGASVNPRSCEESPGGAPFLCTVWEDQDFVPDQPAYYYARALENPSCRWSAWVCAAAGVDCSQSSSAQNLAEGLKHCCRADHRPVIRERALSSPIWYQPIAGN